jgi:hypothetical protein
MRTVPSREEIADATRDARAIATAIAAGDQEAAAVVLFHAADLRLTAAILADWLAAAFREAGADPESVFAAMDAAGRLG